MYSQQHQLENNLRFPNHFLGDFCKLFCMEPRYVYQLLIKIIKNEKNNDHIVILFSLDDTKNDYPFQGLSYRFNCYGVIEPQSFIYNIGRK